MYAANIMQIAVTASVLASGALAGCNNPRLGGIKQFNVADGQDLQRQIANNNLNPSPGRNFELKAGNKKKFTRSSVKACVVNSFLFENTHVALGDVAFAVNFLLEQCGSAGLVGSGLFLHQLTNNDRLVVHLQSREILVSKSMCSSKVFREHVK